MHYVYVLQDEADAKRFYVGFTGDLMVRLVAHNEGRNASTRGRQWRIVYYEAYVSRDAPRRRESVLKHDGRSRRALMDRIKASLTEDSLSKKVGEPPQ